MDSGDVGLLVIAMAVLANSVWLLVLHFNPRNILRHDAELPELWDALLDFSRLASALTREIEYSWAVTDPPRYYQVQRRLFERLLEASADAVRTFENAPLRLARAMSAGLLYVSPRFRSEDDRPGAHKTLPPDAVTGLGHAMHELAEAFGRQDVGEVHEQLSTAIYIAQTRSMPYPRAQRPTMSQRVELSKEFKRDIESATQPVSGFPSLAGMGFDDLLRKWRAEAGRLGDPSLYLLVHLLGPFVRFFRWFRRPQDHEVRQDQTLQLDLMQQLGPLTSSFLKAWQADDLIAEYRATCLIITLWQKVRPMDDEAKFIVADPPWDKREFSIWRKTA